MKITEGFLKETIKECKWIDIYNSQTMERKIINKDGEFCYIGCEIKHIELLENILFIAI